MANKPNFRIAMRKEGDCWNCYLARPETMQDAVLIGHLSMTIAQHPDLRQNFIDLMGRAVELLGGETFEAKPAPEHERSGSA